MQKLKIFAIMLLAAMLVIPASVVLLFGEKKPPSSDFSDPDKNKLAQMQVSVYRKSTGKIENISCYDYICGVVAGEMQANCHIEALKAQAVAAFTYTVNKMNYVRDNPETDIGHSGAYVCDDYAHCKAYLERGDALKKWGSEWFDKYYPNIEKAVADSLGMVITYDGEPINAVFHAVSNGKTCSAKEVWGADVPYLQSVDCECDSFAPDYTSTVSFTHSEFSERFKDELGVELPEDYNTWLGEIKLCDSGMVEQIIIAGTAYSGTHIRKLFSLRSATFSVEVTDTGVVFTVSGYGHGVGMSQFAADYMAKEGKTCREILTYFYKDTKIEDYKI